MTNSEFINFIAPIIVKEAKARGYNFPSAIIAQAAVESNYGRSLLSSKYFNFFGMKCGSSWDGKSVKLETKEEYSPGQLTKIKDNFRAYESAEEGISGYFDFIKMKRYANLKNANSPLDYIEKLKNDGWATSSTYVRVLYNTLTSNSLTKYDLLDSKKSDRDIALEVISGVWGNGEERRARITRAGYDYNRIQALVNEILKGEK